MVKVILTIAIVIACIIVRITWDKNHKKEDPIETTSEEAFIYRYILDSISEERFKPYVEQYPHFYFFKEQCISELYNELFKKMDSDKEFREKISIKKSKASSLALSIYHSEKVENKLYDIFSSVIEENIEEAKKNESDAISYNDKFDEKPDSEPELHPIVSKNNTSTDDDIIERSLDELSSIGTVEEIEEDENE